MNLLLLRPWTKGYEPVVSSPVPALQESQASQHEEGVNPDRRGPTHGARAISPAAIALVLLIVVGFNVCTDSETLQNALPFLQSMQLSFHRGLCGLMPRHATPKWVRVVAINDEDHRRRGDPTSRRFLGTLIRNAVRGAAATVVLDIKLLAPQGLPDGQDDQARKDDNAELFDAIDSASSSGVPVVLSTWLARENDRFSPYPNIFAPGDIVLRDTDGRCPSTPAHSTRDATCAIVGNVNLPRDMRQVPLTTPVGVGASNSLSLAAVEAYEESVDLAPRTETKQSIVRSMRSGRFPFASFIPEALFQTVSSEDLSNGTPQALRSCRGRILVIGGTWHKDAGYGDPIDAYKTPAGTMAGVYVHANYIEALLDDRYGAQVPSWLAGIIDVTLGILLYVSFHKWRSGRKDHRLAGLLLLLIPVLLFLVSYVFLASVNIYLDFVLPLAACLIHLIVEMFRDYLRLAGEEPRPA